MFLLDYMLTYALMPLIIACYWFGVWMIIDLQLYPENFKKSTWMSAAVGYTAVIILFVLQVCKGGYCIKSITNY